MKIVSHIHCVPAALAAFGMALFVACSSSTDAPDNRTPSRGAAGDGRWAIRAIRQDGGEQRLVVPSGVPSGGIAKHGAGTVDDPKAVTAGSVLQDINAFSGSESDAYQLVRAAARRCDIRANATFTAWPSFQDSRYVFQDGADIQPGCNSLLQNMQVELCVASALHDAATSASGTPWVVDLTGTNNFVQVQIPPQSAEGRFIARRWAIYTLANLALTDVLPPALGSGAPWVQGSGVVTDFNTCSTYLAATAAAGVATAVDYNVDPSVIVFGPSQPPEKYFPDLTTPSADVGRAAAALLLTRAKTLQAAAQLVKILIEEDFTDSLAMAESQRSHAQDPVTGAQIAWGLPTPGSSGPPFNTLAYAGRDLLGRWNFGQANSGAIPAVTGPDPKCGTQDAESVLPALYGPDLQARFGLRKPKTGGEKFATGLVLNAGIVVPQDAATLLNIKATRGTVLSQILARNAVSAKFGTPGPVLNPPLDSATVDGLAAAYAIGGGADLAARWNGLSDEEVAFALGSAVRIFQMNFPGTALPSQLYAVPGQLGAVTTAFGALGGEAIADGMPALYAGATHAGAMQLASQCPADLSAFSATDLSLESAWGFPFQSTYALGQSLQARLVKLRKSAAVAAASAQISDQTKALLDAAAKEADFAQAAARTWAGTGRVTSRATSYDLGFGDPPDPAIEVNIVGIQPADLGLPAGTVPTVNDLKKILRIVSGDPWYVDCALGFRKGCPIDATGIYDQTHAGLVAPVEVIVATDTVSDADGLVIKAVFFRPQTPESVDAQWQSYLVSVGKPEKVTARGRLLSVVSTTPGTAPISPHRDAKLERLFDYRSDDASRPRGYCLDGVPADLFVPLANELTSDNDTYENSWKHYLAIAATAAAKADDLGEKMIQIGLQRELRREQAQEQVGAVCGVYGALDHPAVVAGSLTLGQGTADQAAVDSCTKPEKVDVVFVGADPFRDQNGTEILPAGCGPKWKTPDECLRGRTLGCKGAPGAPAVEGDDELCAHVGALTHGGLQPSAGTPPPPAAGNACDGVTAAAKSLKGGGLTTQQVTALATNSFALPNALGTAASSLHFTMDHDGAWVLDNGLTLMSTRSGASEQKYWPNCKIAGVPCAPDDEFASRAETMFTSGVADYSPEAIKLIGWRVQGALWGLARLTGSIPAKLFTVPVPVRNWAVGKPADVLGSAPLPHAGWFEDNSLTVYQGAEYTWSQNPSEPWRINGTTAEGADTLDFGWPSPMPSLPLNAVHPDQLALYGNTIPGFYLFIRVSNASRDFGLPVGDTNLQSLLDPLSTLGKVQCGNGYESEPTVLTNAAALADARAKLAAARFPFGGMKTKAMGATLDLHAVSTTGIEYQVRDFFLNSDKSVCSVDGAQSFAEQADFPFGLPSGKLIDPRFNSDAQSFGFTEPTWVCGNNGGGIGQYVSYCRGGVDGRRLRNDCVRLLAGKPRGLVVGGEGTPPNLPETGQLMTPYIFSAPYLPPSERMFWTALNTLTPPTTCGAVSQVVQALALSCESQNGATAGKLSEPPTFAGDELDFSMITGTEAWLHRLEIDSDRIVSALYVTNVPKSIVIDVMQGKSEPRDVAGVARTDARGA